MSKKSPVLLRDTSASELDLRIGFEAAQHEVKVYDLVPDLGIIKGFGVDKTNRKALGEVINRLGYVRRDCVYLLLKRMSVNYVGMTQNVVQRLDSHVSQRTGEKSWDRSLVFYLIKPIHNTSLAAFVERTLYIRLTERGFRLNQTVPDGRILNPDDQKVAQRFVAEIERILELLDMADPPPRTRKPVLEGTNSEVEADVKVLEELRASQQQFVEVELRYQGAVALGKYSGYGLEVYSGSVGTAKVKKHMEGIQSYWNNRQELLENGVIDIQGDTLHFVKNYTFSSPTAAAQILTGSNRPGPLVWRRVTDQKTLKELPQYSD